MKALSLELVRGSIDQVGQEVTMTWVQPRVLDLTQVTNIIYSLSHPYVCFYVNDINTAVFYIVMSARVHNIYPHINIMNS